MVKRMLIDAEHKEETRVCVVDGNRLEDFDFESKVRKQIKGNIYLAKVTRVEPSLQAAFVEYGGNRHGFLAFSEIHPDYYRIPMEDRQALIDEEQHLADQEAREDEAKYAKENSSKESSDSKEDDKKASDKPTRKRRSRKKPSKKEDDKKADTEEKTSKDEKKTSDDKSQDMKDNKDNSSDKDKEEKTTSKAAAKTDDAVVTSDDDQKSDKDSNNSSQKTESVGGQDVDVEEMTPRRISNLRRRYKIQEVIKRRQIMLVQITKEERGNKGAAMTTYISLPGRYCVLMPNSPRGGGVSRKISNPNDRRKMRDIMKSMEVPKGMSVILRTAGLQRTKAEIKRDLDYLLRLWDDIRKVTLESMAPALVYEEGDLIKRSVRDLYSRDIDEVMVSGEDSYRVVKDFMKNLIPSHAKRVKPYKDDIIPLFQRYQVESQIDEIFNAEVRLKSGGSIVINPTEALVSIDVNSGKSTRERHIDDTALKTNLEAAEEVARQLRLRDLGGLVVIDFIDMENNRHNAKVERRMKEVMSNDRARVEIGRLSNFGLLELSRQRLRPSLLETHFQKCEACNGMGLVRTIESAAVVVLRAIEEEGIRNRAEEISVNVPADVALYILNYKRATLADIEQRYKVTVFVRVDEEMSRDDYEVNFSKERRSHIPQTPTPAVNAADVQRSDEDDSEEDDGSSSEQDNDKDDSGKKDGRRGRRSRGGRRRGRNRNNNRDENNNQSSESQDDSKEAPQENRNSSESKADEKPADDKKAESPDDDSKKKDGHRGGRRGRSPYGRRSKRKDYAPSDSQDSKPEQNPATDNAPAKQDEAAEKQTVNKAKSAASDPEKKSSAGVQSVNQKPSAPKRGWWQKLVE